jgi:hypothetical protein
MSDSIPDKMRADWDFAKIAEPILNDIVHDHVLRNFFRPATKQEDTQFCTDVMFMGSTIRLAHRTRRISNTKATRDLTIRMSVGSGYETEIDKIEKHCPHIYVLAWLDGDELVEWVAIDFIKFTKKGLHRKPESIRKVHSDGNTFGCWSVVTIQSQGCLLAGQANAGQLVTYWWTPSDVFLSENPKVIETWRQVIRDLENKQSHRKQSAYRLAADKI